MASAHVQDPLKAEEQMDRQIEAVAFQISQEQT